MAVTHWKIAVTIFLLFLRLVESKIWNKLWTMYFFNLRTTTSGLKPRPVCR
jgi:hypothetical protein